MKKILLITLSTTLILSSLFGFEHLKNLQDFEKKTAKGNVIVEFYASWCQPCKEMKRNLQKLNTKKQKLKIYQVNIEEAQDIVDMYGTPQVPAILYMKDGEILQGFIGLKQMPELNSDLKKYFRNSKLKVAEQGQ